MKECKHDKRKIKLIRTHGKKSRGKYYCSLCNERVFFDGPIKQMKLKDLQEISEKMKKSCNLKDGVIDVKILKIFLNQGIYL